MVLPQTRRREEKEKGAGGKEKTAGGVCRKEQIPGVKDGRPQKGGRTGGRFVGRPTKNGGPRGVPLRKIWGKTGGGSAEKRPIRAGSAKEPPV